MIANCTALILAGGDSRRMGQDKANLMLGGHTLLQHMISIVQPLFAEVLVSTRKIRVNCDLQQVYDNPAHAGPLAGLAAGFKLAKTPWLFVVACDMPFITPQLIARLAEYREHVDAVVPVFQDHPQPMAAYYSQHAQPAVQKILAGGGKQSLRELLEQLQVCYVNEDALHASELVSFFDLDTPEDMAQAIKQGKEWNT